MQLPVELLLTICHSMSPDDLNSLSYTCRAMFAFINTKAPFRKLNLTKSGMLELSSLYRHSRVLAFANEVHWNPKPEQRRSRHYSTNGWTMVGLSIRLVLPALPISSSLRLFQIHPFKAMFATQRVIFSVPTLTEIVI